MKFLSLDNKLLPSPSEPNLLTALRKQLPKKETAAIEAWVSTFYPFQKDWLLEPSRFAVCLKSRQIGMSHTTAGAVVLWGAFLGETSTVVSIGEREAQEVVDMSMKHAQVLQRLGSDWARCRARGNQILFENGSGRILALPSSSGGRGFSGNVFLDEFAYQEKPDKVWDAASGATMHGYKFRISSTPNGVGNEFHSFWSNPVKNNGWVKHEVSIKEALAAGMNVDLAACWKMAKGDPRVYAQLFECSFLDSSEQYLPTKLVQEAQVDDTTVEFGEYHAGYDVGLSNDLSVLVILRQTPDNRVWVQAVIPCKRTDWDAQQEIIFEAFATYGIKKLCIDSSGIGIGLVKALQKRLGSTRVEGVNFSLQSKEELATDMYQAFGDRMISIPRDAALEKDLLSIRRVITTSGNVRYDAPHTADGHADRAWALALAIHACTNKPAQRVAKGPGDFGNT